MAIRELHLCYLGESPPDDPLGPPGTWSCHDWTGCLGHNLAVAGALVEARRSGERRAVLAMSSITATVTV